MLKIGLIINPYAGIGGRVGLKGSDGPQVRTKALQLGGAKLANHKAKLCFEQFKTYFGKIEIYTRKGEMGAALCRTLGLTYHLPLEVDSSFNDRLVDNTSEPVSDEQFTSAKDTKDLVQALSQLSLDLILFVGGDGTARDVSSVVVDKQLVLGVPAGVKIHSGVYAISPEAAGKIVLDLLKGKVLSVKDADVVDLDEDAFRAGKVKTKYHGEMCVPSSINYMQVVKSGSAITPDQQEAMDLVDIAADVIENMDDETFYVIGSGTTCAAIMDELGLTNTLLGSDIIHQEEVLVSDATENDLIELLTQQKKVIFILTIIGGQGHILGRGNHQISPEVIRKAGWRSFEIIATKAKLNNLEGRPLQVDTGSTELDHQLFGLKQITTGYHEKVIYSVGFE